MNITRAQRQQAEEGATATQLQLYAEPEAGEALWKIATMFNLTEKQAYRTFTEIVGDVILGFYKQTDLAALINANLPQLNTVEKGALEAALKTFLLPLASAPERANDASALSVEINEVELQSEIVETEDALEHLPGIRTMASDMHAIQHPNETTHSSSQSTILERNNGPRWDTEQ